MYCSCTRPVARLTVTIFLFGFSLLAADGLAWAQTGDDSRLAPVGQPSPGAQPDSGTAANQRQPNPGMSLQIAARQDAPISTTQAQTTQPDEYAPQPLASTGQDQGYGSKVPEGPVRSGPGGKPYLPGYKPDKFGFLAQPPDMVVSTSESLQGFRIQRYLGVVRGVMVRQPTIPQGFTAGFKGLIGGSIGGFTRMCEQAREQAYQRAIAQARALGANAIVGMRFGSSMINADEGRTSATEVVCYGTAVIIQSSPN